ncbi:hypothetical protein GCM10010294_25310 [Streptomyces griseoloalbus]|uniref:zinc finger domain-containing protein n=1 Tax=Streptomyces griseoloalbus TaxID=67303 RepID=UPI001876B95F|nr:hypothetical protein GCM10010294_25310 [Streptomyces griseoloalbus]
MKPAEIPQLLAQIALADPRVRREDPIEMRAQIQMWAGILADVPPDFALHAAQQHYATSTWPILPAEIATRWQAVVRDRMNRDVGTFEPQPGLDPDDVPGYLTALREQRQAVVYGQQPPAEVRAITAGPAAAEAVRRVAQLGDYLTTETRTALAPYRPIAAARLQAAQTGQPDALAVACPVHTCRAAPGQPCQRPSRRHGRHRLTEPHPSRTETAATTDPERTSA